MPLKRIAASALSDICKHSPEVSYTESIISAVPWAMIDKPCHYLLTSLLQCHNDFHLLDQSQCQKRRDGGDMTRLHIDFLPNLIVILICVCAFVCTAHRNLYKCLIFMNLQQIARLIKN